MSDVANLELCRELYELSGWSDTYAKYYLLDGCRSVRPTIRVGDDWPGHELVLEARAYDLGYLLRRIGEKHRVSLQYCKLNQRLGLDLKVWEGQWIAYTPYMPQGDYPHADSPEDAAAMLAIDMFKRGVLKRTES